MLTAETKHVVMDEPEIISIISNGKNKISAHLQQVFIPRLDQSSFQ